MLLIANVVFGIIYADRLRMIGAASDLWGRAAIVVFTNLLWGFYQELTYRGILQTELSRGWGPVLGILFSNLVFTGGPLHFYHFSGGPSKKVLAMFAGIFLVGLFFGVVFRTSGNLWIVGILHGLGDCYLDGFGKLGR